MPVRDFLDQAKSGGKTAPTLMMRAASFCSFYSICEQQHPTAPTPYVSSSILRLPPHMRAAASCGSHPIWEQHHSKSCISERMKRRKGQHQCCFPNVDAVWPAASSSIHHDFPTDIKSCIPRGTVSQSDLFSSLSCFFQRVRKVATTNASR